jgi:hypothetical protein
MAAANWLLAAGEIDRRGKGLTNTSAGGWRTAPVPGLADADRQSNRHLGFPSAE